MFNTYPTADLETGTLASLPPEVSWREHRMSGRLEWFQDDASQILKILKKLHAWVSDHLVVV